jgi:flagellar hook-associated protein 3 FlgL
MLAGLDAFNSTFLNDLSASENRISRANQELSSGYRVNQPADDPGAINAILGYQSQIDQVTQTQSNLTQASIIANISDSAIGSANTMLAQLTSIATQGASSTATAASRSSLGQQVQGIEEQLVSLANTTFSGRYVFGGDNPSTQPYTFNWSVPPGGVVRNNPAGNSVTLANSDGDTLTIPGQTAQQIFDAQTPTGSAALGNIFQNVYALGQALQNNQQVNIQAAAVSIQASVVQLGQAATISGNTLSWLQQSSDTATSKLTNLQTQLSGLRDADAAQAATELTTAETAMNAAVAAHGSLNIKSLFSYLG